MDLLLQLVALVKQFIDIVLHLDIHLVEALNYFGPWMYLILFIIIFAETGLVIIPFLPGDSLLFATGALCALSDSPLNIYLMASLLFFAAVFGDFVNYSVGKYLGPKVFKKDDSFFFNKKHLLHTQDFYERHGNKTIIIARFVPIVRTFAPFVAGIGRMNYKKFSLFNITGAFFWIVTFLYAGYFFGNLPLVKRNFHIVIFSVILISILPIVFEWYKSKKKSLVSQPQ